MGESFDLFLSSKKKISSKVPILSAENLNVCVHGWTNKQIRTVICVYLRDNVYYMYNICACASEKNRHNVSESTPASVLDCMCYYVYNTRICTSMYVRTYI